MLTKPPQVRLCGCLDARLYDVGSCEGLMFSSFPHTDLEASTQNFFKYTPEGKTTRAAGPAIGDPLQISQVLEEPGPGRGGAMVDTAPLTVVCFISPPSGFLKHSLILLVRK